MKNTESFDEKLAKLHTVTAVQSTGSFGGKHAAILVLDHIILVPFDIHVLFALS